MKDEVLEFCDVSIIHEEVVKMVRDKMPAEESLNNVAELFKVFGDPTRAKIICALTHSEMCVCDIAALLNMTSSAISHQLRILKQARVIRGRRDGKTVYYRLDDEHINEMFNVAFQHAVEI